MDKVRDLIDRSSSRSWRCLGLGKEKGSCMFPFVNIRGSSNWDRRARGEERREREREPLDAKCIVVGTFHGGRPCCFSMDRRGRGRSQSNPPRPVVVGLEKACVSKVSTMRVIRARFYSLIRGSTKRIGRALCRRRAPAPLPAPSLPQATCTALLRFVGRLSKGGLALLAPSSLHPFSLFSPPCSN